MSDEDHKNLQRWKEALWHTFVRLECDGIDESSFYGSVKETVPLSHGLTIVSSTSQRTMRSAHGVRTDPQEFVLCALQVAGEGYVEQSDRQARTTIGDIVLYETTRPYTLLFKGHFEQIVLKLPRSLLDRRVTNLSNLTGRSIQGSHGVGAIVRDFIQRLAVHGEEISKSEAEALMAVAADLIATASHAQFGDLPSEVASFGRIRQRLRGMARDHTPDLAVLAQEEHMSLRTMQRVFHANGTTPSRVVLAARLDGAMQDILSNTANGRVGMIAMSWGFNDLSYFSKAFRARFGIAPGSLMRQNKPGVK